MRVTISSVENGFTLDRASDGPPARPTRHVFSHFDDLITHLAQSYYREYGLEASVRVDTRIAPGEDREVVLTLE